MNDRAWLENVRDVCVAALGGKQIEEKGSRP